MSYKTYKVNDVDQIFIPDSGGGGGQHTTSPITGDGSLATPIGLDETVTYNWTGRHNWTFDEGGTAPVLSFGLILPDTTWMKIEPDELNATNWYGTLDSFPNGAGVVRKNQVINLGWNISGGGGKLDPTEGVNGMSFESHYEPVLGTMYMEQHLAIFYPVNAGLSVRALSFQFNINTSALNCAFSSDYISIQSVAGTPYFTLRNTPNKTLELNNSSIIASQVNNYSWLTQLDSGGSQRNLAYLDNTNIWQVADSSHDVHFGQNIIVGGTVEIVGQTINFSTANTHSFVNSGHTTLQMAGGDIFLGESTNGAVTQLYGYVRCGGVGTGHLSFFGAADNTQYNTTGTVAGYTANVTANFVYDATTFTGNSGATAYTVGDIVKALKSYGLLAT